MGKARLAFEGEEEEEEDWWPQDHKIPSYFGLDLPVGGEGKGYPSVSFALGGEIGDGKETVTLGAA